MLKFLKLHIQGFASYEGDNVLDLNPSAAVVIKAPNGSGKSTIFSALVWALYGKNLKGVSEVNTKYRYRTKEYKGTLVEVYFQKYEHLYKVIRCQNYTGTIDDGARGRDRLVVIKDAEAVDIKSKPKLQEYLVQELGLSYSLFMNSIMFGQGMKKLIQETNSDKKKIFEEVFNLNYLNMAKTLAQKEKNALQEKVRDLESDYQCLKTEYDSTMDSYDYVKTSEDHFEKEIFESIGEAEYRKKSLEEKLKAQQGKYSKKKAKLVKSKLKTREIEIKDIKEKLERARNISNQPLLEVIDSIITLLEKGKSEKALVKVKSIKKAFQDIDSLQDQRWEVQEEISKLKSKIAEWEAIEAKCESLEDQILEAEAEIKKLKKKKKPEAKAPEILEEAKAIKKKMKKKKALLEQEQKELEDYNWLLDDPLSNKGIKAFLFDSSLGLLNDTLAKYAEVLGFRISFEVDLESTKKDFVTLIEMDGEIYDYDELSGGQQQLCNVAMAFAMNESLTASKDINIAFLDEVFESLSMDNVEIIINLIKEIFDNKVLFLITHHESLPLSKFRTLRVDRAHGRSSFKLL